MRALLAASLLLLPPLQEVEKLVEQLSDEDIAVRERAAEKLLEKGVGARPALEKAARSGDPEVVSRAKSLLGEIELAEGRRSSLGPAYKISLPAGSHTLAQLAARIREESGVEVRFPAELLEASITTEAREMLLMELIDHLCTLHGGLRVPLKQPQEAIVLEAGKPSGAPARTSGPFRVWIDRLRLERRDPFETRWERGSMVMGISWQPNVRPISSFFAAPRFRITELKGDDGKDLEVSPRTDRLYSGMTLAAAVTRSHREFVPFQHPAPGVRRLSVVRGAVDVMLPLKYETVTFQKPLESAGQRQKAGDHSIQLKSCIREEKETTVVLHFAAPKGEGGQRLEIRARIEDEGIELVDREGKSHKGRTFRSAHSHGGDEGETHEQHVVFPAEIEPSALKVRFLAQFFDRRVEFAFKDVELP